MEYISLRISAKTLNTVGAGLQELPYKLAKPALDEIDEQVQRHIREQTNDRAKSGEAGNTSGDGDGPDRNYVEQDRQAGRSDQVA